MSKTQSNLPWITAMALLALAGALRVRALFTDFWLDEIWSYEKFARGAHSVADIFFNPAFRHDNNQQLNTTLLYLIGDQSSWAIYRLPAFVAGLLTVAIAIAVGRRRTSAEGWLSGLAVAGSFMMVVYSTEARGYAFLLLFALLGFWSLRKYLEAPSLAYAACFWVCVVLGLAAHTSIAHFYLGALLWSGFRLKGRTRDLARLHVVPVAYALLWALVVLRGSLVGGGPPWTWNTIGDQTFAWTLGYPLGIVPAAATAAAATVLVLWDAARLWREGSDVGLFFVGVIFGPPVLVAALGPPWMFPRYFLVSDLFLLLVFARWVARLWSAPGRRAIAVAIASLFLVGNLTHIVPFSRYGRGGASEALRTIASSNPIGPITITSPSTDLWTSMPLRFYGRVLGFGDRLRYVPHDDASASNADWVVVQTQEPSTAPDPTIRVNAGTAFVLRAAYPFYGPSGMRWSIYQRTGAASR